MFKMTEIKNKSKLFECSLGFHEYTIPYKNDPSILICKHCKRFGYYKSDYGYEYWTEYDNKGNQIYFKDNRGNESWYEYNNKGNEIHYRTNNGRERWLHKGNWVDKKPKNWEYENEFQKI